jgi:kynureninase
VSHALAKWRSHFPILETCTYLASHSLGAVPRATAESLAEYYELWATRGILAWDGPWWHSVSEFSGLIATILNAPHGAVVPMQNATRAMAAVASCLDYSGSRNRIVMTDLEFTTSYPFWRAQERLGAQVVIVKSTDGMTVDLNQFIEAIDDRTAIVPTSHVYFRSGAIQDLKAISIAAHKHGAYVLGDGYQTVGTVPVDVLDLDVDFYVGGSHKWLCGGPGAGYLYVRSDLHEQLRPRLTGWFGLQNPFAYEPGSAEPLPADGINRFLGGTPNVPALYAAREGLKIVADIGVNAIREVSQALTAGIIERADSRGLTIRTPRSPDVRSGMVCIDFAEAEQVAEALVHAKIVVDWRPGCGIRLSPHFYNVQSDLDQFFSALDAIRT